jgi:ankyrin repeat protein
LLFACQQNKTDLVNQLIQTEGVDPCYSNPVGQSALHIAAGWGHVECLSLLLKHLKVTATSTDSRNSVVQNAINAKNTLTGATPLHCCLQKNYSKATNTTNTIESSSDHNGSSDSHKNDSNEGPDDPRVHRRLACVHLLIEAGADLEIKDMHGKTPVDYWKEHYETEPGDDHGILTGISMSK